MALPGDIREIVREELYKYWYYAFDEQRDWKLNDWRVYVSAPVRHLIPYGDDVLVVTGIYGGVYSLRKRLWLLKYDRWFDPFRYEYIPGDDLDILVIASCDSPYLLTYRRGTFKWVELPAETCSRISRPYKPDEKTLDETCYIYLGDTYEVAKFNPRTFEVTRTGTKFSYGLWGFGCVGSGGKWYIANERPSDQEGGIWEYNPETNKLTRVYTPEGDEKVFNLVGGPDGWFVAILQALDKKQVRLLLTKDFSTYYKYILPESIHFKRGVNEFGISWNVFKLDEGLAGFYVRGIVYVLGYFPPYPVPWSVPNIAPLFGSPIQINDIAPFEGNYAIAFSGIGAAIAPPPQRYYGVITLVSPEVFFEVKPPPAYAVIWDNTSIEAGETSLPVVTAGWTRKTLMFEADTDGTLTIEIDVDGSDNYKVYDTVSITANTPRWYMFTGDFARMRLKFDTAAKVTAKLYLHP